MRLEKVRKIIVRNFSNIQPPFQSRNIDEASLFVMNEGIYAIKSESHKALMGLVALENEVQQNSTLHHKK
jgi:hypothetical protein